MSDAFEVLAVKWLQERGYIVRHKAEFQSRGLKSWHRVSRTMNREVFEKESLRMLKEQMDTTMIDVTESEPDALGFVRFDAYLRVLL